MRAVGQDRYNKNGEAVPAPAAWVEGLRRALPRVVAFGCDKKGATAVEFAIIAFLLIVTILFVMVVGLVIYLNQALDYATYKAGRQVMIGAAQKAGTTQSTFPKTYLCPFLPAAMACANSIVSLQTVQPGSDPGGYYAYANTSRSALTLPTLSNAATPFSPGTQGSYEYLQVVYPVTFLPNVITSMLSNGAVYNGSPAILITSTAAFRNEQY